MRRVLAVGRSRKIAAAASAEKTPAERRSPEERERLLP